MTRQLWMLGTLVLLIGLGSCTSVQQSDWYDKAHDTTVKVADVAADKTSKAAAVASTQASKAFVRMQHYLAEKDVLKTFTDSSEHSETVVLDVLHKAGVGSHKGVVPKRPAAAPGAAPAATAPSPNPPRLRFAGRVAMPRPGPSEGSCRPSRRYGSRRA